MEKERSVAILANIADGIVAVDRDGKVVLWNAAAEEITGVPQVGSDRAHDRAGVAAPARIGRRQRQTRQRLVAIQRGGEEVWLSLSEAVMRDPLGTVAGRIFAFRDISADRMVEQVKSDFVAAVSHELRTPLTSIYGFAETLLRQDVPFGDEDRRIFLGYIASESERLTEIVDQLLNVARLDTGDLQVELGRIDVASVVSEIVGTVDESGAMNGHNVEVDLPARAACGRGRSREGAAGLQHPRRERASVLAGRREGDCRRTQERGPGRGTGRGRGNGHPRSRAGADLPQVLPSRIGGARRRGRHRARPLHRQGARDGDGRAHLGGLDRRGRVELRVRAPRGARIVAGQDGYSGGTLRDRLAMTKVLVIDDEAPIRLLCRVNLEAEGMNVIEAADGPSGLDKARDESPDVILLDVMMPGLDGWRVAEQLLDDERTVAIPIIFLTARAEFRDRARGLDIGGIDYVTKPFNPLELAPLVEGLLDRIDRGEKDELRAEKLTELRSLMESE